MDRRRVAETDISPRLGSPTPVYTMNVGVAYEDGSCGGLFVFEDAIVEYRSPPGAKGRAIRHFRTDPLR